MTIKYPSLHEIGIKNPEEIIRYSFQTNNDIDNLRIVYKRKQGSLLPSSKKFRFPRAKKMVAANSDSDKTTILDEISPFLHKVINELDQIVNQKHTQQQQKDIILDEIKRLDEEMTSRMSYIKSLVEDLK